mgnify:CR=1 FL=1
MLEEYERSYEYPDIEKLRDLLSKVTDEQKLDILQRIKSEVAGMTVLHKAAYRDDAEVLKTILSSLQYSDRPIVLMMVDNMNRTPLHEATLGGHTESVKAILDSLTADQQLQLMFDQEWDGKTAVEMASGETAGVMTEYRNQDNQG